METTNLESLLELVSSGRLLSAGLLLAATWLALFLLDRVLLRAEARFPRYRLIWRRALPVVRAAIWVGVIWFAIARVLEPPRETMLALMASVGLAIGLAAQDLVRSLIAGVLVMIEQPFQIGDMVRVGEHQGEVVAFGLRSLSLRTFNDDVVAIPNSVLLGEPVVNSSSGNLQEQVAVEIVLPASVDATLVKRLAETATACSPYVYLAKPITVLVEDVFDGTLLTRFKVKAYVADLRFERLFASDIVERIKSELLRRGIVTDELVRSLARQVV